MWCQFMCVDYHLLICQSSLLQLVTQLLFITYFNAPFHCHHGSYLLRAFTLFLLILCFCFLFGLCLFVFFFTLYFWWMGSYPWFLYIHDFSICNKFDVQIDKVFCHFFVFKKKNCYVFNRYIVCLLYNSPWMTYRLLLLLIVLILKFLQEMNTKMLQCS